MTKDETKVVPQIALTKKRWSGKQFDSAPDYIKFSIERWSIEINAKQVITGPDGPILASALLDRIELAYDKERRDQFFGMKGMPNFPKMLGKALSTYMEDIVVSARATLKSDMAFDPFLDRRAALRPWLVAVTGHDNDMDAEVLSHWMWLVKRHMFGLPVCDHIMPILYGPQGSGKTEALTRLLAPLVDFWSLLSFDQVLDPRMAHSTRTLLAVLVDEMANVARAEVSAMKSVITARTRMARRAYSPIADEIPQTTAFIGATNEFIQDIIKDETGMRRFYVVNSLQKCDWEAVNRGEWNSLWRSIDQQNPHGYLANLVLNGTLRAQQAQYLDLHPALKWLEECGIKSTDKASTDIGNHEYVADTVALEELHNFMDRNGLTKRYTKYQFTRQVSEKLGPKEDKTEGRARSKGWYLNKDRTIHSPTPAYHRDAMGLHYSK